MALSLDISICQVGSCKSLTFTEKTGAYNASTNTGGYGSPNATIGGTTSRTLAITMPDESVVTINNATMTAAGFPTTDCSIEYEITSAALGLGALTNLPDGLYTIVYTVVSGGTTYTKTVYKLLFCQAQCCVHGILADISSATCGCNDTAVKNAAYAFTLLEALKDAARCGDYTRFDNFLTTINALCETSDCGCDA
jgi:hypothetical protein